MANNNSTLHLALGLNDDIVATLEPELNPLEFHHAYSLSRDTTLAYNYLYEIWLDYDACLNLLGIVRIVRIVNIAFIVVIVN